MKLDHYNIAAPMDLLDTVKEFYMEVLGFEEGFRPSFQRRGFWLYAGDRPAVHLIEGDRHAARARPDYLDHIAFRASGLADYLERLERNGVSYRRSYIPDLEMTQLFFDDPAGTGLELNFPGETE